MVYVASAAAPLVAALMVIALVLVATPRRFPQLALIPFVACGAFQGVTLAIAQTATDPHIAFGALTASEISVPFIYAFYIIFAAANLRTTPLVAPFRGVTGRVVSLVVATAIGIWILVAPEAHFVAGPEGGPLFVKTPLHEMLLIAVNMVLVLALVASIHAFMRAPRGTEARRRAKAYAIAFGVQDVLVTIALILLPLKHAVLSGTGHVLLNTGPALGWFLLVRYMVRAHLFDADLRLQRGIRRGVVASVFLGAFVIVAELVQDYLSDAYGYLVGGLVAALLLLAIHPIQRMADRLAQSALPRANDPESLARRKLEVYRAALESTLSDGNVTEKERRTLATLADQLGISAVQALDAEREIKRAIGSDA